MWIATAIFDTFRFIYGVEVAIENESGDSEVTVVQLRTKRPFRVFPGGYFYILRPGSVFRYSPFSSHAMTAAWYTPGRLVTDGKVTSVTMLVSNSGLHHPIWLEKGQHLRLLGPYGRDLGLPGFETVILTAKGIGIAGVLPLALDLAERKLHDQRVREEYSAKKKGRSGQEKEGGLLRTASHDSEKEIGERLIKRPASQGSRLFRDATRKVDLFWELERNRQDEWVAGQLNALQSIDPHNVCGVPCPRRFLLLT